MSTAEPGEWPWDQVGRLDSRIPGHGRVVTESMAKLNRLLFKYKALKSLGYFNHCFPSVRGKCIYTVTAQITANSDKLRAEGEGGSKEEAIEEAARQLLKANNNRLLHLLAECEAQQRLAPADSNGDCASFVDRGPVAKFKPKVGSVVQAKFNPQGWHQLAQVVTCDNETCGLRFFRYSDVPTIPITDVRPLASGMPHEDELLFHVIIAQAVLIREEISHMTCGQLKDFPDAAQALLAKAREQANEIIHALALFQRDSLGHKAIGHNPYEGLDPEERNKKMMETVVSIYADLDEHFPRLPGEESRSEIFARHCASVMSLPASGKKKKSGGGGATSGGSVESGGGGTSAAHAPRDARRGIAETAGGGKGGGGKGFGGTGGGGKGVGFKGGGKGGGRGFGGDGGGFGSGWRGRGWQQL